MSFRLGTLSGIPIRLHWLFLVLVAVILLRNGMAAGGAAAVDALTLLGILFGSVVLHELGHAVTARRFGARIVDITLWPLGGLTRMTHMPERALPEVCVAVAGPAVNGILLGIGVLWGGAVTTPWSHSQESPILVAPTLLDLFTSINFALAVFNLAPAFPMDGGRALRGALSARYGFLHATELAVRIGRWFAVIAVFAAAFYTELVWPVALIAIFLWIQGAQELADVRMRHGVHPLQDFMDRMMGMAGRGGPREAPRRDATPGETGHGGTASSDSAGRDSGNRDAPESQQNKSPEEIRRELESFRGSMEEYFRERDGRGR